MMTREAAMTEIACEILADSERVTRVVVAAIVAEMQLARGDSAGARNTLSDVLTLS